MDLGPLVEDLQAAKQRMDDELGMKLDMQIFKFLHKEKLTFFSSSPQRPMSVSISAPFSVTELSDSETLVFTP